MIDVDGCPEGMFPMDSDFRNEEATLNDLIEGAEDASNSLNFPISWYLTESEEDGRDMFEITFLMPRKHGKTWSIYTYDFDRTQALEWVMDFPKRAATDWYGWNMA